MSLDSKCGKSFGAAVPCSHTSKYGSTWLRSCVQKFDKFKLNEDREPCHPSTLEIGRNIRK